MSDEDETMGALDNPSTLRIAKPLLISEISNEIKWISDQEY